MSLKPLTNTARSIRQSPTANVAGHSLAAVGWTLAAIKAQSKSSRHFLVATATVERGMRNTADKVKSKVQSQPLEINSTPK